MATYILLHGSFHAAWNWHRFVPLLREAGHEAIAIDLPGHGRDRTSASRVSLDSCVDRVLETVDRLDGNAVLVAHSRNGIVISRAAERRPERIDGLVYLAAYLVPNGRSMMELALEDRQSLVVRNVETALPRAAMPRLVRALRNRAIRRLSAAVLPLALQTHSLARAAYREALYHDCGDEITELANVLLEPEPNWPGFEPLRLTDARYGSVPKVYVECLQDRAVTLELQRRMQRESPCNHVFSIDSGHSPFFSRPGELVTTLIRALDVFAERRGRRSAA